MFIIVGLGNPGREYENTRHNVGFMTVDMLADRFNIEVKRHNFRAVFGEGYIGRRFLGHTQRHAQRHIPAGL